MTHFDGRGGLLVAVGSALLIATSSLVVTFLTLTVNGWVIKAFITLRAEVTYVCVMLMQDEKKYLFLVGKLLDTIFTSLLSYKIVKQMWDCLKIFCCKFVRG